MKSPLKSDFSYPDFRNYWLGRVLSVLGTEMLNATVLWQMWNLTKDPFDLGLVGLAQFGPFLVLFLFSGLAADKFPRKHIITLCLFAMAFVASGLAILTLIETTEKENILLILILVGIARAFQNPSQHAIVPLLVPKERLSTAIAWSSVGSQVARITGPAFMGILLLIGVEFVYATVIILFVVAGIFVILIKTNTQLTSEEPITLKVLFGGLGFIWSRKIIFGAISLDLFAVLFGGATALLPIFATDILNVGEMGYGSLRMAMMVGSIVGMFWLTRKPIRKSGGPILLIAVALFGFGVILFGLSKTLWISIVALFVMGVADSVSVYIRNLLVQSITPDEMRGRVSAVSSVFIGASNEIGEFESGITAAWWGVVPAVIVGGIGTIVVATIFAIKLPALRRVDNLDPDVLVEKYR